MRTISWIMLMLLSASMLSVAFSIRQVMSDWTWTETIYIQADGSIYPATAPISSTDNVTYTITDNITGDVPEGNTAIIIERDSIIVDGAGHMVQQGAYAYISEGIYLGARTNVTIKNMTIKAFYYAIYVYASSVNSILENTIAVDYGNGVLLDSSYNNSISGNKITVYRGEAIFLGPSSNYNNVSGNEIDANNGYGITLYSSSNYNSIFGNKIANGLAGIRVGSSSDYNSVYRNEITYNANGIWVELYSSYNRIYGNEIIASSEGIIFYSASGNTIFHNNFINTVTQAYCTSDSSNSWDNGYPSGGNHWSNYNGTDLFSGPYQNETGSDGIGDSPYLIDANNRDRYPFMLPWGTGDINGDDKVTLIDLVLLANAYGSHSGDLKWNPNADINNNGTVDLPDLVLLAQCYGKIYT